MGNSIFEACEDVRIKVESEREEEWIYVDACFGK